MRLLCFLGFLSLLAVNNAEAAKIAVTDLTYSETVSGYFHVVDYHSEHEREGYSYGRSKTDYTEVTSNYSYIEYGELRKFVGDIKGEILKSGFKLTQAKPYTSKGSEKIFDIIARIKKGYYPGADYVLFGTVTELDFRDEQSPVVGTDTLSNTFSLMLVAEFSLINTRTYEVKAAFSATGEGQDARMATAGSRVMPSRGKVIAEVSKSLGEDVAKQMNQQLGNYSDSRGGNAEFNSPPPSLPNEGEVIHFTQ